MFYVCILHRYMQFIVRIFIGIRVKHISSFFIILFQVGDDLSELKPAHW